MRIIVVSFLMKLERAEPRDAATPNASSHARSLATAPISVKLAPPIVFVSNLRNCQTIEPQSMRTSHIVAVNALYVFRRTAGRFCSPRLRPPDGLESRQVGGRSRPRRRGLVRAEAGAPVALPHRRQVPTAARCAGGSTSPFAIRRPRRSAARPYPTGSRSKFSRRSRASRAMSSGLSFQP